ncbi:Tetratricopeptide repeat-containing protein [Tangfeifania diversioriginum]|uniref:Tetratricopeptide repeat-containing protein n=1 Tax=Tangfeifania diversioriginum TaxID=1168035 RepID=A0A1M6NYT0_9BACT|nr:tetratricopeptide repeat protein [Tangfeifania diversioriginum]SHK00782.1 Tetratricopeptide repeat-containing protein [Tangfeifania diversioriginum]
MTGRKLLTLLAIISLFASSCVQKEKNQVTENEYSGSESCIQCHERFYELWAPSWHGKAMQPVNAGFIKEYQLPECNSIEIEDKIYQMIYEDSSMVMLEMEGDDLLNEYPVEYSLGGKNVFTFLTPLEKGKLQTIPLAYDVNRQQWFNYPESAVRHFGDTGEEDQALPWRDRMYAFNTACYNCHVSQVSSNYNLETDTYHTTWKEAGINCETCHGPSAEHVRVFQEAEEKEEEPEDWKILVTSNFTSEEHNSSCAVCHAKGSAITKNYVPPEPYFDHFTLATLEDPDFYPDGRDLGENYTMTGWKMNPCIQESDLHCVTCHTSSGRNRFADNPNAACTSCHDEKQGDGLVAHTMHQPDSEGSQCVNCHVPSREFVGRFIRSDHSFRPPMPEATIKFGSPNACNQCHHDKSPEWANEIVKARPNGDYQEETLYWAQLIKEAREENWDRMDEMLEIIRKNKYNEVVVTSFIRLLVNSSDEKKWESIIEALNENESPLVRAAASSALTGNFSEEAVNALITAASDEIRLVRVSAAASLAGTDENQFSPEEKKVVANATGEYLNSMVARPDDWSSHYNLGIYHQNQGNAQKAIESYETAARIYPEALMPLINSSVLYSYMGNAAKAEENLKQAVKIDPDNEAANLNLGLLLAEQGKMQEAEKALKTALEVNPKQAVAAYNLSVIVSQRSVEEAIEFASVAAKARPDEPKYAYTLAYYQLQNDQKVAAEKTLGNLLERHPIYLNAVSFLADIYMKDGRTNQAIQLYKKTLKQEGLPQAEKQALQQALNALQNSR